ncbi:MAG: GHKL domain-containing protein [Lachnospiraceae bacterium]|nr:GHKL domain-containing protein [Ruminococcus sp.]MCM1276813.1 GHKL domain-containing protein [Lachnospiraceae bacterium]
MPKIIEYILCLMENGIIFIFLNSLIERRSKNILTVIAAIVVNASIIYCCYELRSFTRTIILAAITIAASCIIFKGKICIKAALSVTVIFMLEMINILFGNFSSLMLSGDAYYATFGNTFVSVIVSLIIKAADILAVYFAYKMFSKRNFEASGKVWTLYCVMISTYLFIIVTFTEFHLSHARKLYSAFQFAASSGLFITGMITIYFFTYVCGSFANEKRMYILQSGYDGIKEQLAVQSENSEKIGKIRHDTKNHLQNAQTLLSQGHYDAAKNLIAEMIEGIDNIHLKFNTATGNSIIDAAIAVKSAICRSSGIDFVLCCEKLPQVNISEIDLSSLISNILDNAITAAEKTDTPRVKLKIFVRGEYLNIISENSYSGAIKKRDEGKIAAFFTTKCNSDEHGFGTKIIGEIAQKYNGTCVYEYANGFFKMNVMLNYSGEIFKNQA